MRFNKSDTALVVVDLQIDVLSEKETVTMKSVSPANAERNDKLDQLSADLASSVYQVTFAKQHLRVGLTLNSICGKRSAINSKRSTQIVISFSP